MEAQRLLQEVSLASQLVNPLHKVAYSVLILLLALVILVSSSLSRHLASDNPASSSLSHHLALDSPASSNLLRHLALDNPNNSSNPFSHSALVSLCNNSSSSRNKCRWDSLNSFRDSVELRVACKHQVGSKCLRLCSNQGNESGSAAVF